MADVMDEMEQLNVTYTVEEQLAEKELMETINRFLEEMSPKDRNIFCTKILVFRSCFCNIPKSIICQREA